VSDVRRTGARILLVLLAALACGLAGAWMYPVGGRIWTADQVSAVAAIHGDLRMELADPDLVQHAARDALAAARADRLRRIIPDAADRTCVPLALALRTGDVWVDLRLRCSSGLLFDSIPREAWRQTVRR